MASFLSSLKGFVLLLQHYGCVAIAIASVGKCLQRYLSQVKVISIATFCTTIAVVAAAVSSNISDFSAFTGIRDLNLCGVFVFHAVINVRSLASHLQGIRKSIADEVEQVVKPIASISIAFIAVIVAMIA